MKAKILCSFLLVPTLLGAKLSREQFKEETIKHFYEKFERVDAAVHKAHLDQTKGLAKVYSDASKVKVDEALTNQQINERTDALYMQVTNDPAYMELVERMKNAKTQEEHGEALYKYMRLVYLKATKEVKKGCPGVQFLQEDPHAQDKSKWMAIDNVEYLKLNQDKAFNKECEHCLLAVNLVMALLEQNLHDSIKASSKR